MSEADRCPVPDAGPFRDVRILDFTEGTAGALACMLLADLGAETVRLDAGHEGSRRHPADVAWHRNKLSLALDPERASDRRALDEVVASADVAVFDAPPGELERLRLDPSTLRERNSDLLHVWMPPYGSEGQLSRLPPDHGLLTAVTGVAFMQYSYEDRPIHLTSPQVGYGQALIAAAAIASALYDRARGGCGRPLTITGIDAMAAIKTGTLIDAKEVLPLGGLRSSRGAGPNYRLYQCADGDWLFLGCLRAPFFVRALELMDMLELFTMPGVEGDFTQFSVAPYNEIAVTRLEARFAERTREQWLNLLDDPLVPVSPVESAESWFHGETVAANDMRVTLDHPSLGPVSMPGVPVKLSGDRPAIELERPTSVEQLRLRPRPRDTTAKRVPATDGGPLAGVCVLDLATFIAGAFASTVLANFGAEVTKIEPPDGDPWRAQGLGFIAWNRGKRSAVVDLKRPEGRELLYDLVRRADVVVDNYRVGVRGRLGVDYETLRGVNPRIVTCSITAYGPSGPLAHEPGFDTVVQARSGMMRTQGGADEPVALRMSPIDTATAIAAAFGVAAALHERERTGEGREVQTSLAELSVFCQFEELVDYAGRPPRRRGGRDFIGPSALERFYRCADGWLALQAAGRFDALCSALGRPEWRALAGSDAAAEPADGELAAAIATVLAGMRRDEALERLLREDVPAAPAIRQEEILHDPFLGAHDLLEQYEHPDHGLVWGIRGYGSWGETRLGFIRRAPLLGEHTVELLAEFGVEGKRIDRLLADGVIRQGT